MRIALVLLMALLITLAAVACPAMANCPVDDLDSVFTGVTRSVSGRMFAQYRCPSGHRFWVRCE